MLAGPGRLGAGSARPSLSVRWPGHPPWPASHGAGLATERPDSTRMFTAETLVQILFAVFWNGGARSIQTQGGEQYPVNGHLF